MGKDETGKFELRQVQRDSEGKERYIKAEEDDAIWKSKLQQFGIFANQELKDATFDQRVAWIEAKKQEGNEEYK